MAQLRDGRPPINGRNMRGMPVFAKIDVGAKLFVVPRVELFGHRVEARMVRTNLCRAAVAAVAVSLTAAAAPAGATSYVRCSGVRPEYSPGDQLYKQAPISASARLALSIRWREYLATCHGISTHRHHWG
jgi:hypothetical protein